MILRIHVWFGDLFDAQTLKIYFYTTIEQYIMVVLM